MAGCTVSSNTNDVRCPVLSRLGEVFHFLESKKIIRLGRGSPHPLLPLYSPWGFVASVPERKRLGAIWGHDLGSRLKGRKQAKKTLFSFMHSSYIHQDRKKMTRIQGRQPLQESTLNFAVNIGCAYFTKSHETGKLQHSQELFRNTKQHKASSELLGFSVLSKICN